MMSSGSCFISDFDMSPKKTSVDLRDFFAANAMIAVMQESQEMKPASFWDWIKMLLQKIFYLTFLEVKYVPLKDIYVDSARRAYQYADRMMAFSIDDKPKRRRKNKYSIKKIKIKKKKR